VITGILVADPGAAGAAAPFGGGRGGPAGLGRF
jgi:hypothetical protein